MNPVILDISRLISRIRHSTPSGVDRVEMAWARGLLAHYGDDLHFAAVHPSGIYGRIAHGKALAYLDMLEQRWKSVQGKSVQGNPGQGDAKPRSIPAILPQLAQLLPHSPPAPEKQAVYLQSSPHHLTNMAKKRRILTRERAKFLCLVHDLIPIEFPEYARPTGAALHRRRMETIAALADGVIVNSADTARAVKPWLRDGVPVHIALLGTEVLPDIGPDIAPDIAPETGSTARPYFLCLGTIEPRKNHLLLLHLWRHFANTMPAEAVPRLVIIGRRGWENEQVLDMLERSPALHPHVEEIPACPDTRLSALLRGARGLLMPSFAEGFGMPVAEALSVGTPVICSDIAAHREVGGDAPDYIGPLDGAGWHAAIMDYAERGHMHRAQMARLAHWRAPTWEAHIRVVTDAIEGLRG